MAIINHSLGYVTDALGNAATLSYSYDDTTMQMTQIVCDNKTPQVAIITAKRTDGTGQVYSVSAPANTVSTQPISTGVNNRLKLTITPSGKLDGVEWSFYLG